MKNNIFNCVIARRRWISWESNSVHRVATIATWSVLSLQGFDLLKYYLFTHKIRFRSIGMNHSLWFWKCYNFWDFQHIHKTVEIIFSLTLCTQIDSEGNRRKAISVRHWINDWHCFMVDRAVSLSLNWNWCFHIMIWIHIFLILPFNFLCSATNLRISNSSIFIWSTHYNAYAWVFLFF